MSSWRLMRAAQKGDADAYRALLTAVTPRIRRVVRARRGFPEREDAEDLVQDVCCRFTPFSGYVRSVATVHAVAAGDRPKQACRRRARRANGCAGSASRRSRCNFCRACDESLAGHVRPRGGASSRRPRAPRGPATGDRAAQAARALAQRGRRSDRHKYRSAQSCHSSSDGGASEGSRRDRQAPMNTDRLIESLARDLAPAPALRAPSTRAAWWLLGAGGLSGYLTLMMTSGADVAANGISWSFVFPQVAAVLTGAAPRQSPRLLQPCRAFPAACCSSCCSGDHLVAGSVVEWRCVGMASGGWRRRHDVPRVAVCRHDCLRRRGARCGHGADAPEGVLRSALA